MKGIPVCIYKLTPMEFEVTTVASGSNGVALTHAELKELMREAFEAGENHEYCSTSPDFETYYQGRGK